MNADGLMRELHVDAYQAAALADAIHRELVNQRESFAFETVFSDPADLALPADTDKSHGRIPVGVAKRLPRYPLLPATLLGRLAVDRHHHGQGIGEFLLLDALHRACEHAVDIAAAAVIVDAIDPAAARFYQRFGFMPFPSTS